MRGADIDLLCDENLRLTFIGKRANIQNVYRWSKTSIALSLAFFFIFGVLCVSISSPSLAIASTTSGCWQDGFGDGHPGCNHRTFFRSLGGLNLLPKGSALVQSRDSFKEAQAPIVGIVSTSSTAAASVGVPDRKSATGVGSAQQKIPIHLLNSVLSL